jgi:hypothetical protein
MGADQIEKFVIESGCVPISLVSTGDVPEIAAVQ